MIALERPTYDWLPSGLSNAQPETPPSCTKDAVTARNLTPIHGVALHLAEESVQSVPESSSVAPCAGGVPHRVNVPGPLQLRADTSPPRPHSCIRDLFEVGILRPAHGENEKPCRASRANATHHPLPAIHLLQPPRLPVRRTTQAQDGLTGIAQNRERSVAS